MTRGQKAIAIATLSFNALLMHALFCDWHTGPWHRHLVQRSASTTPDRSGLILSLGPAGVYARSYATYEVDVILGISIPLSLLAAASLIWRPTPSTIDASTETDEFRDGSSHRE